MNSVQLPVQVPPPPPPKKKEEKEKKLIECANRNIELFFFIIPCRSVRDSKL